MALAQLKFTSPTIRLMPLWWLVPIVLSTVCILTAVLMSAGTGSPLSYFFRDANAIAGHPPYYGLLEHVTSSIMLMTGAVLFFTAVTENQIGKRTIAFGALFGLLTAALGADDLFMVHESAQSIHPFLKESIVFAFYALVLLGIIIFYHRQLMRSAFVFLIAALGFLATGGAEDQRLFYLGYEEFWELIGFIVWGTFAIITAIDIKRGALED